MRVYDIIRKKRDGHELTRDELSYIVTGYIAGVIPDYQISALLMAIFFRGMAEEETVALTKIMLNSGVVLDFSDIEGPKIDKHSTGGVGDKTSIILAPLVSAAGIIVPMVSGRALAHTGGTLDKLESIPGFRTDLSLEEFGENLKKIGISLIGQSEQITPADRKFYALRDVTVTVDSVPLIASSIMSKKLAEGVEGLVLDVKAGSGAFMKNVQDARRLAKTMVYIGNALGIKTVALLTGMDQPLGRTIGNSLEIKECISALQGRWPDDLKEVTLSIGAWMIDIATTISDFTFSVSDQEYIGLEAYKTGLLEIIHNGSALQKFSDLVDAQGGNPALSTRPDLLPSSKMTKQIIVTEDGYIQRMDAEMAGIASLLLGAGRQKMDESIDHSAGIVVNKKVGDFVMAGEPVAIFHYSNDRDVKEAEEVFLSGIEIGAEKVVPKNIILEVIH